MNRPCLDCGQLTPKTRCHACHRIKARRAEGGKVTSPLHRDPVYRRVSRQLRAEWTANPFTICWICSEGGRVDDPWTADHVVSGDPSSPLLPAHRSCNSRRGARERWSRRS